MISVGVVLRHQLILGVRHLPVGAAAEVLDEVAAVHPIAAHVIDRDVDQIAPCLRRGSAERGLRREGAGPNRLDDRLKDRHGNMRAVFVRSERAALAVGIVVADPDRHGDVIGEADEPAVDEVLRGAGLAGDERRQRGDPSRRAARHDALQNALELIECRWVGVADARQRGIRILIDGAAVLLDGIDAVRLRQRAFVGDGGIEGSEIDHLDRLCAENEWIIAYALRINFRGDRGGADVVEALFRAGVDAAIEDVSCNHVD